MKRKVIAVMLAALTVCGAVTGCAGGGTTEGEAGTKTEDTTMEDAQEEKQEDAKKEDTEEEPYTVTMVLTGTQQRDEERIEEKINAILEPELNMKLDLIVLPWGSSIQQLQLMLSGDEKIDCFYTDSQHALQYMNNGQIADMTELIDKYGTNLKEIIGEYGLKSLSVGGFTIGIPVHFQEASVPGVFMRKDLVEKYNIDVSKIKEPADLGEVFAAVKAGEPNMDMLFSNGSTNGPLYRLGFTAYDPLGSSMGVLMDPTSGDTTVTNLYESDWYMDTAKMLYDWYKAGYINKDAATESESWSSLFKAGQVFSMITGDHPGILTEFEVSTGYEFEVVDFTDVAIKKSNYYSDIIYAIAQNSEDPDKTMQCLDYMYGSADIMNLLNWGEEGVDYVYIDEEKDIIDYPEGVTLDNVGYSFNLAWELPNGRLTHLWKGSDPDVNKKTEEMNEKGINSTAFGFIFDSTGMDTQIAALDNVYNQYAPSIGSGTVDPEEYVPKFVEALKTAGVDTVIEEKQKQLDAYLEQNK
ncbi:MAG: ABC transporter substrate-binding protein [Lachnospiraceae bacterium]|nr:ABC transporter substrate-binding protein [Lachnospiraceae bacterium]